MIKNILSEKQNVMQSKAVTKNAHNDFLCIKVNTKEN